MTIKKIKNIFSEEELNILYSKMDYEKSLGKDRDRFTVDHNLGRLLINNLPDLPDIIFTKLYEISKSMSSENLGLSSINGVEYNNKYGTPNLPVHYDHDTNDLIINFQLSSNTKWDIGIDLNTYEFEDNTAIVFNANKYTHWRPHKIFKNGEYIKMIFFRFYNIENPSDYTNLSYSIDHPIFEEINKFRDSLGST